MTPMLVAPEVKEVAGKPESEFFEPDEKETPVKEGAVEETEEEKAERLAAKKAEETEEERKAREEEEEEGKEEPVKTVFNRPTRKEVLAKFPDFFKTFPDLQTAFYREAEFTKLFPTVEDAKEAFEDNEAFTTLRESVLSGDSNTLMEAIEKADTKALDAFASSFLPSLYKRNSTLYQETITPLFENLLQVAFTSGERSGNEDLQHAAEHLAQFLFGDPDVAEGKVRVSKVRAPDESDKIKSEREATTKKQFDAAFTVVNDSIKKQMSALIRKDFDPDEVFSAFSRRLMIDEIVKKIGDQLEKDEGHMSIMRGRWRRASLDGFSDASKEKIIIAYISRARSLVPSIREKVRAAALATKEKAGERRLKEVTPPKKEVTGGRSPSGLPSNEKFDYRKKTDLDLFNE